MKVQASILFLAAILSPAVLARPASPDDTEDIEPGSVLRLDSGAATNSSDLQPADEAAVAAAPKKCISFTSDNPNWHYANAGVWGSQTGTFGKGTKKICVPRNQDAGGAMFIGTKSNPSAGNTKLECKFPVNPTSTNFPNCDMSLVDGYSLSVTCKVEDKTIGGPTNLWKTGQKCYDQSQLGQDICRNARGTAAAQKDVTEFFQQGIKHGNHYCIYNNCRQDYPFNIDSAITCHVSGGR